MVFIRYDAERDVTECGILDADWVFKPIEGALLRTHSKDTCTGDWCDIHNPNPKWDFGALSWRSDRGIMERICEHGVGHPSREGIENIRAVFGVKEAKTQLVHGCCGVPGCCHIAFYDVNAWG